MTIPLMLSLALLIGVVCQIIARFLQVPGIVLFLIGGIIFGPDGLGVIDPEKLGSRVTELIGMAVSVILFEGGMLLRMGAMKRNALVIRRLITSGAMLTAICGMLAARVIMDWSWTLSFLFGTLIIVTGPTVVTPLLHRIGIRKNLQTILQSEGVLIDPIGALIAVIGLEVVISGAPMDAAIGFADLGFRLLFGAVAGAMGGMTLVWILRRPHIVPDEYANVLTLSAALVIFQASNAVFHESGIMTVTIAGIVVGNARLPTRHKMLEFKEQLTLLLIGLLFVVLTASIRMRDIMELGWRGFYTVLAVMFIVRPIVVIWSTRGTTLGKRERMFMSFLAPRGIVAAAVASLFATRLAENGFSGGNQLRALVFLVIATTVILQGLTADAVAGLLGVRRPRNNGYAILGANRLARALAQKLMEGDQDVVLLDRDGQKCKEAQREGLRIVHGNIMETSVLRRAQVDTRRGVIGLVNNVGVNLEALRKVQQISRNPRLFLTQKSRDVNQDTLRSLMAVETFGNPVDTVYWSHLLDRQQVEWVTLVPRPGTSGQNGIQKVWQDKTYAVLPLTVVRQGQVIPYAADVDLATCSELTLLMHSLSAFDILQEILQEGTWQTQLPTP
ncbi:cation:proton antiporter [Oligoflexus tunisiensis]|uniref:cation:proton antiporter n=1 Tax=Oligoflexus tunisiensis TaxID=708132 RepID=UPI00114CF494|nr:sodium:proton antiporter [Oligoflexus tunisiensis]